MRTCKSPKSRFRRPYYYTFRAANAPDLGNPAVPPPPAYYYVDNSKGLIQPYLDLVTHYGCANYMFQTNQGPSFPAHQFLFGGTSAPSAAGDAAGIFRVGEWARQRLTSDALLRPERRWQSSTHRAAKALECIHVLSIKPW